MCILTTSVTTGQRDLPRICIEFWRSFSLYELEIQGFETLLLMGGQSPDSRSRMHFATLCLGSRESRIRQSLPFFFQGRQNMRLFVKDTEVKGADS